MEEKVIAVGKEYLIKKVIGVVCLLPLALFVILCFAMLSPAGSGGGSAVVMLLVYGLPLLAIAIGFLRTSQSITVTDKRVFGSVTRWLLFTRRVDLPLDSISSVGTGWPKAISVATSSGNVAFKWIKNQDEVYTALNCLLMERQSAKSTVIMPQPAQPNTAGELKQYKELLTAASSPSRSLRRKNASCWACKTQRKHPRKDAFFFC